MVVLLVDDDVAVQLFIWKLLNTDEFTVLTAGDGTYALAASRNYPGTIESRVVRRRNAPDGRSGTMPEPHERTPRNQSAHDVRCA
jgi:DNA-binding response OmpR family regulator